LQLRVEEAEPKLETALVGAPGDAQGLGSVVLTMGDENARASRLGIWKLAAKAIDS
jgi:hypothetical protein